MKTSRLRIAWMLCIMMLATLVTGAAWLAATEQGLRFLVARVTASLPGHVQVGLVEGRVIGPVILHNLRWDFGELAGTIEWLELDWNPAALLQRKLAVKSLHLRTTDINHRPSGHGADSPESAPGRWREFSLPVRLNVNDLQLDASRLRIDDRVVGELPGFRATVWAAGQRLVLGPFDATLSAGQVNGQLSASLNPTDAWDVNLSWTLKHTDLVFSGETRLAGPLSSLSLTQEWTTPARAAVRGTITGLPGTPLWNLEVKLEPLAAAENPWPAAIVSLLAHGNDREAHVDSLTIRSLGGTVTGHGHARWRDQPTVDFALHATDLDPMELSPHWPGRVGADLRVHSPRGLKSGLDIEATNLAGELRAQPLGGSIRLSLREDFIEMSMAELTFGDAALSASGHFDTREERLAVRAEATGITIPGETGLTLLLDVNGTPADHQLHLRALQDGSHPRLELGLDGSAQTGGWEGRLTRLSVHDRQHVIWQLQEPAPLYADQDQLRIGIACMKGQLGQLCLEGERLANGRWRGTAELEQIDLEAVTEWFGLNFTATGTLSGAARLAATADGFEALDGAVSLSEGSIRQQEQPDTPLITWSHGQIDLTGDATAGEARLDLVLADEGHAKGNIRLCWNQPDPDISGVLEGSFERLSLVTALAPQLSALGGQLGIRWELSGTLGAPQTAGLLEWTNGYASLPELGVTPSDIRLRAEISHGQLEFTVAGRSGDGQFDGRGHFDLRANGVHGNASLRGENLKVAALPGAHVEANPDIQLDFVPGQMTVSGQVTIPAAQISTFGSAMAVPVSADEVIIATETAHPERPLVVVGRVQVSAGPAVKLHAGGLRGRIEGTLLTIVQPDADPSGRGELRIVDGEIGVLGQTLTIETGRLLYDGQPLVNPVLEIRAVRRVQAVTAGATVRGTLQQPEVSVFSDPPLPTAEALAYLTLGKSIDQIQTGDEQAMQRAAGALALAGGGLVMQDLARRLGFGDLEVSAESRADGNALIIGKYLGSGLYISYGLGLFDTINTLRLRYQLNPRLSVETVSGEKTSADLYYSFERK